MVSVNVINDGTRDGTCSPLFLFDTILDHDHVYKFAGKNETFQVKSYITRFVTTGTGINVQMNLYVIRDNLSTNPRRNKKKKKKNFFSRALIVFRLWTRFPSAVPSLWIRPLESHLSLNYEWGEPFQLHLVGDVAYCTQQHITCRPLHYEGVSSLERIPSFFLAKPPAVARISLISVFFCSVILILHASSPRYDPDIFDIYTRYICIFICNCLEREIYREREF